MPLVATRDLCVSGIAVPVVNRTMDVVDPFGLHAGKEEDLDVYLVEFMAGGTMTWLEKALKVRPRWFKDNAHRIPFLAEILGVIRQQKNKDFGRGASVKTARLPRCRDCLMAIEVRGKVLLVKNDSRYVCFADLRGPDLAEDSLTSFNWFLSQLESDAGDLQEMDSDERAERAQAREFRHGEVPADIQSAVQESLQNLRAHENCQSAAYFHSRNSFKVKRGGDSGKAALFRVQGLAKKRKAMQGSDGEDTLVRREFDLAVARASSFLDSVRAPVEPQIGEADEDPDDARSADSLATDGLAVPENSGEPEVEPAGPAGPAASSTSGREPAGQPPS